MKSERIPTDIRNPLENHFVIKEIEVDDIAAPSERFREFILSLEGLPFLNRFTLDDFMELVRESFVSKKQE